MHDLQLPRSRRHERTINKADINLAGHGVCEDSNKLGILYFNINSVYSVSVIIHTILLNLQDCLVVGLLLLVVLNDPALGFVYLRDGYIPTVVRAPTLR